MPSSTSTIAACIAWGRAHENCHVRLEANRLENLCAWRELPKPDLEGIPASGPVYLERIAPRFDKKNTKLVRDINQKYTIKTYQQYQRAGARLINRFTGAAAATGCEATRDDWSALMALLSDLAAAGLVARGRLGPIHVLAEVSRRVGLPPTALDRHHLPALRSAIRHSSEWGKVDKALGLLDTLRVHSILAGHLPKSPIGRIEVSFRRVFTIPESLAVQVEAWVDVAAREQIDDARLKHLAAPLSDDARTHFLAALRNFVCTAAEAEEIDLTLTNTLAELFECSVIDAVIGHWVRTSSEPGGLSLRSIADYCAKLTVIVARNGLSDSASYIRGLRKVHKYVKEGDNIGRTMSPRNQAWCRNLLADPAKIEAFDTQHVLYFQKAREALSEAEAAGLDLRALAAADLLERLPKKTCSLVKRLVRRAQKFGTCAAFAAIELEGAPFRKSNTLDLAMSGPRQTFFDHSDRSDAHFTIVIPNEMLKNGGALSHRGDEMPPIEIRDAGPGDHGFAILDWFIHEIRPLFPKAAVTNSLFPALGAKGNRLATRTFDLWLFECSSAIGLPLKPHNFRHGYVSLQYAVDRSCLSDLAIILGDTESTLRRHYRFIDASRTAREIQESVRQRRDSRREAWRQAPMLRSA